MGLMEKIDIMDLMINSLREHERSLDELVRRLDAAYKRSHQSQDEGLDFK